MSQSEQDSTSQKSIKEVPTKLVNFCCGISLVLSGFLLLVYLTQWDFLAGLTNVPAFCWLIPAGLLLFFSRNSSQRWLLRMTWCVWIGFLIVCVPESISLTRVIWRGSAVPVRDDEGQTIRVVSFNLGDNPARAIEEILPLNPDIVLLQEVSSEPICRELGTNLFGENYSLMYYAGQAILARGKLVSSFDPSQMPVDRRAFRNFVAFRIRLTGGRELAIACVHLAPPSVSFDFLSSDYWNKQSETRTRHRSELAQVMSLSENLRADVPFVLGGDFNAPAGDGCTDEISFSLRDTFAASGVGWGNTGPNQFPLHRVDQIWVSEQFTVEYCGAIASQYSDHRIVLCDLRVRD